MNLRSSSRPQVSRRGILKSAALASLPLGIPLSRMWSQVQRPMTANGGTEPYPIPWLDKNGSHNQPGMPGYEPAHIYHFKGLVARCNGFAGQGPDGAGNQVPFGTKTTDFGIMMGEYYAGRTVHEGAFVHL